VASLLAHPAYIVAVVWVLAQLAVAVTPRRYQTEKWYGGALWLAHRLSFLAHYDQLGTLQLPIIARAVWVGQAPDAPAPPSA
jgi:hypothetical protein